MLNYYNYEQRKYILPFVLLFMSVFAFGACSSNSEMTKEDSSAEKKGVSFSFYDDSTGNEIKAYFTENEISSVYINGEKIPDNQITIYKDKIYSKLNDVNDNHNGLVVNLNKIKIDSAGIANGIKALKRMHKFHFNLPDSTFRNFSQNFKFDMKDFSENMEKLKDLNITLKFNAADLKEKMKELKKNLRHLKINRDSIYLNINEDELADDLKEAAEDLKEGLADLEDMPEFKESMKELKEKLQDMKVNLKDMNKGLKKIKIFAEETRKELVKDNYLSDKDDDLELSLSQKEMKVNDKVLPENLHKKYLEMYEKYMGKKLEGEEKFKITN